MKKTLFYAISLILMASFMLSGCGSSDTTLKENNGVANATGTVTGRVRDASTLVPIEGASVSLIVNGAKMTATSQSSTDPDLKGYFTITGVPAGIFQLKINAEGYGKYATNVTVAQSNDNTPVTANLGTISLGKSFDLKVVVTDQGVPVAGATVCALLNSYYYEGYDIVYSVTDASGVATLSGLANNSNYTIFVPAYDSNGDGKFDYQTASMSYSDMSNQDRTVSLLLTKATRSDIGIIARSTTSNHDASFTIRNISDLNIYNFGFFGYNGYNYDSSNESCMHSTGQNNPIWFVFNYPVFLAGEMTASWIDYLINPDQDNDGNADSLFNTVLAIDGVTFSLDPTGTILKVIPPTSGWPKVNSVITLKGLVGSTAFGNDKKKQINEMVYIEDDTASGLNSSTVVSAAKCKVSDTYYSDINIYLEFPEYVYGSYCVEALRQTSNKVWYNTGNCNSFTTGELFYADGNPTSYTGPHASGIFYGVKVYGYYSYYSTDYDMIRVSYNVKDAAGNQLVGKADLVLQ